MSGRTPALDRTALQVAADLVAPGRRSLWAGLHPPVPGALSSTTILDPAADCRLDPALHGQVDTVLLLEDDLSASPHWPWVVDEALRALDGAGTLVVRHSPGPFMAAHGLMGLLHRRSGGRCRIVHRQEWAGTGQQVTAVEVGRTGGPGRPPAGLSFALVTDGRQPERVREFVESVRGVRGIHGTPYEVLVCGPRGSVDHLASPLWDDVRLVEQPEEHAHRGWITRKKNLLVAAARHDLVLVAHDRYTVAADWLEGLRVFGTDLDVVVPAQRTPDGTRYPDWVGLGHEVRLAPVVELPHGAYHPDVYLNGGALLARTELLREVPWNELLFWAEAEDVELTRRLQAAGVVPRFSRALQLETVLSRPDQVSAFERRRPRPGPVSLGRTPGVALAVAVDVRDGVHPAVVVDPPGATPPGDGLLPHVLAFSVQLGEEAGGLRGASLVVETPGQPGPVVATVNGSAAPPWGESRTGASVVRTVGLPPALVVRPHDTLRVRLAAGRPWTGQEVRVAVVPGTGEGPTTRLGAGGPGDRLLGRGWHAPEDWGRWSRSRTPSLVVGLEPGPAARLLLHARGMVPPGRDVQTVAVLLGGRPAGVLELGVQETWHALAVPAGSTCGGVLHVGFEVLSPVPPTRAGRGGDHRTLGIGLLAVGADDAVLRPVGPAGDGS
ncbi:glycosyltransferase family 2 protein [Cellulomonas marina]|uniref:Glycosyltransferase like family 2 n=1 Tax=Cellulomonas marina TaxID=988821 RepID=A0A1I0UZJ9_9CELL|nr:hypothetical protein [Cellulomonas marina]GIG29913.1 hypothetical protein Cma02nite_25130 [Cellulomonas marina]SFA69197.1 hypothetical protein SAMN05421867_10124 [Cellulomonas marina]